MSGKGGEKAGKNTPLSNLTDPLLYRYPHQRACVYHGGSSKKGSGGGAFQRKREDGPSAGKTVRTVKAVYTAWEQGGVFVTRNGKPVDRSNIFHEMKKLCEGAGIAKEKVYPHNLRHLFAKTYYQEKRDITHLADLLGHASINTTRIYTIVSDKEQIRQIDRLGLIFQIE